MCSTFAKPNPRSSFRRSTQIHPSSFINQSPSSPASSLQLYSYLIEFPLSKTIYILILIPAQSWRGNMEARFGSFRHSFAEKRERERFLPPKGWHSDLDGFPNTQGTVENFGSRSGRWVRAKFAGSWEKLRGVCVTAWEMGRSDPRKIVFSAKMGLALMLISLLIFLKEPVKDLGTHYVWAILTVVVVFEFSIGMVISRLF